MMQDVESLLEEAPKAQKQRGLLWIFLGIGAIHLLNTALASLVIPAMSRFAPWDVLLVVAVGVGGLVWIENSKARAFRQTTQRNNLVQAAFNDTFAVLLFGVLALFAWRLGLGGFALGLVIFGLVWLGVAFARLAGRL